ncbi:NACHT, LRR and PYD domains-containing protein 1 homolog [Paramisgurnus dabryanus]|uniref:NACHT, LRR and PYD domains-containing protein 1 homolog n=1 Tax=Paramisgurnus dabryanus TaxID=90735 RepID=UPI0031F449FD
MEHDATRAQFVDSHWAKLVQRVDTAVMPIVDELWSNKGMLGYEAYCNIKSADTNQNKMRELHGVLNSGGNKIKSAFYSGLEKHAALLLRDLSINSPTTEGHEESLDKYKEWIQREYKYVTEYNSLPGEQVLLCERYTQPLIIMRHREKEERTEELRLMGKSFQQLIISENNAEKDRTVLDALFSADNKGICPDAVILQGNSGKGKSFTAQKIMLDWASGHLNFDCIFHLKCKELNQISEEQSLVEILSINSNLTSDQIFQMLQKSPKRLLVLIDGFDELKLSLSDTSNKSTPNNLCEKVQPEALLRGLLKGCILPKALLLVTTRSTAAKNLIDLLKKPQRFTEILGFSEMEVKEYFQKFYQDEELFKKAYESVKANEILFTACSIPVICWIICTVIRERLNKGTDIARHLETTTSIYLDFVSILLQHHCQGLNESVWTLLKSLGQLAEKGMLKKQVLFDEKTVKETLSDPGSSLFLTKSLFKKRTRQETMYSFMHLSFQEFFTALYYISLDEKECLSKLKQQSCDVQDFPIKIGRPKFDFAVIQFLCGLCNEEVSCLLKETYHVSVPPSVQAHLKKLILKISSNRDDDFLPFILHCLYELHEKDFVQKAVDAWQDIKMFRKRVSRTDCWALVYCLEFCPHVKSLILNFAAEELKLLQHVLCRTQNLELTVESLADTDVCDMISALGEGKLLGKLLLYGDSLSNQSLQQILHALQKQKTVGIVKIPLKNISADTALILTDFLQSTKNWEEIRLHTRADCSDTESFCSDFIIFNQDGELRLNVERCRLSPQNAQSLPEIYLTYPRSEMSSFDLKSFLQAFHNINCSTEQSDGFEKQIKALLSPLSSLSLLNVIIIFAPVLTEKWASEILFFIQSCSGLQKLRFDAVWNSRGAVEHTGLLMEKGIRLLKEKFPKSHKCIVQLNGFRCSQSTECCTHQTKQIRTVGCNQCVTIMIRGDEYAEEKL